MSAPSPRDMSAFGGERVRLRAAVLHYGGLLGWQDGQVITFTEALTNRRWRDCGCPEFLAVLDEYLAIMEVIQTKGAKHALDSEAS